jgi:hypothetical protein
LILEPERCSFCENFLKPEDHDLSTVTNEKVVYRLDKPQTSFSSIPTDPFLSSIATPIFRKVRTLNTFKSLFDMRELVFIILASLCAAHITSQRPTSDYEQQPLTKLEHVPGSNNAMYGPVSVQEQILAIEYLEIAPLPIPTYGPPKLQSHD